jgi:hypothetical protein
MNKHLVIVGLTDGRGFGEGLQWGYGYSKASRRRPGRIKRRAGFDLESAEFKHASILVRAVNNHDRPARVKDVEVSEVYPEPKEKRFGFLVFSKDREKLPCDWEILGFNLVNPGEDVEVEIKPSRDLKDGYGYEIAVGREWSSEEMDALMERGPAPSCYMGVPVAYLYKNGKLEEPQRRQTHPPHAGGSIEKRFCIACGAEVQSSARYCPMCGEKQGPR